ncbi:MAG: mechanosensitive ion channel family protein [Candidatus Omnitrophica bacterium]|nr:mechanosensitive ion channel family protein [Candidatus Omnitrophota bacterium]MDD5079759.1 mechanosensitive ion channel family protein [Candidatus Omnitrophota bacterium]
MYTEILNKVFLGNRVLDYLISFGVFLFGFLAIKIIALAIIRHLKEISKRTANTLDDFFMEVIDRIGAPLLYLAVLYLSVKTLTFHPYFAKGMNYSGLGVLVYFAARVTIMSITYGFTVYLTRRGEDAGLARSLQGILVVVKVIVWTGAVIFFLDNLGFKISAVIAGLGIGGVAVALAAQTILKDLFSYFSIIFDRPFKVGDFIIIGDFMGNIEHVGIKTTRIRSLGGEMLVFSNSDLTDSRVRNYKLMEKRRVVFKLGVTYQTTLKQLKEIPKVIENIVKNTKDTVFDRAHFFSYGDFSLIFEIVYYVIGPDYNKYMDTQQDINFAIKEEFEKRGIEFAYPTQTLYVQKAG